MVSRGTLEDCEGASRRRQQPNGSTVMQIVRNVRGSVRRIDRPKQGRVTGGFQERRDGGQGNMVDPHRPYGRQIEVSLPPWRGRYFLEPGRLNCCIQSQLPCRLAQEGGL